MITFLKSLFARDKEDQRKRLENERDILIIDIKNIIDNKVRSQELFSKQSEELNERAKQAVRTNNIILAKHYLQLRHLKLKNLQQISNEILQLNAWYDQIVQAARMSKHIKQMKQVSNYIKSIDLDKLQDDYQQEINIFKQQKEAINAITDQVENFNQEMVNQDDVEFELRFLEEELGAEVRQQVPSPIKNFVKQPQGQKQELVQ